MRPSLVQYREQHPGKASPRRSIDQAGLTSKPNPTLRPWFHSVQIPFLRHALARASHRCAPTTRNRPTAVPFGPGALLDRQLARLSGVDLTTIRNRQLTADHAANIDAGLQTLEGIANRLAFVRRPFDLANVAATADEFDGGLVILDYVQRIRPPGEHGDRRGSIDALMNHLRAFADAGLAVVVLSAVGRTKDKSGRSSYAGEGLNLASFRESSELEYGADSAWMLTPDGSDDGVILKHLKSRNGECRDLQLRFDRPLQRFTDQGFQDPYGGANGSGNLLSQTPRPWAGDDLTDISDDEWGHDVR